MQCLVYIEPPHGFSPSVQVASCHCEWAGKILLLKRHPLKAQGDTWGVPGGKLEKSETPRAAVVREIQEEIGLNIDDEGLELLGKLYCRHPHVDFVYHMFRKVFLNQPSISLSFEEHLESKWVTMQEALRMPLIAGGADALKIYQEWCRKL